MSRRPPFLALAAVVVAGAVALSCGDVPTLENGIAYVTPIQLPLPTVAAGDTLRDSLGFAAPLRVRAFTRDSQEITGLAVTFLATTRPLDDVQILENGLLVARDTLRSVTLVARIGDRIQTPVATLTIVPEPLEISRPAGDEVGDTAMALPALKALRATVSGIYRGQSTPVNGIIVRYRIDSLRPSTAPPGSAILTNASGTPLRPDSTIAVDTTKSAGLATRNVLVVAGSGVSRVFISASARRLRGGAPLAGSPVRFVLDVKP
ncbi:MAG TPA: hypothetical protein VFN38_02745 [Gemmatimonadaceae bacterium]|nr:hypothetical protein [Gemmatimonadaceae bacterium]